MATTAEFPQVQAAYDKYVAEISVAPTNPTQLIRYCQKEGIEGITWSKCSKFFKSLGGSPTGHHKSTSGPLLTNNTKQSNGKTSNQMNQSNGAADTSTESPIILVTPPRGPVTHKRAQSAVTPRTREKLLQNGVTSQFNEEIGGKFTDLKEEPEPDPDTKHDDDDEFELNGGGSGGDEKENVYNKMNKSRGSIHSNDQKTRTSQTRTSQTRMSPQTVKRISLTPPGMKASTSFKTLPLDDDHSHSISPSMKTTPSSKRVSILKKHSLMSKAWNKNKPPLWPKNRSCGLWIHCRSLKVQGFCVYVFLYFTP